MAKPKLKQLAQSGAALDEIPKWDGNKFDPAVDEGAGSSPPASAGFLKFINRQVSTSTVDLTGATTSAAVSGSVSVPANANRKGLLISWVAKFGQLGDAGFGGEQEFDLEMTVDGNDVQALGIGRRLKLDYAGPAGGQNLVTQTAVYFVAGETGATTVAWGDFNRNDANETGRLQDRTITVWEITT